VERVCDNQAALSIKTLGLARDVAGSVRLATFPLDTVPAQASPKSIVCGDLAFQERGRARIRPALPIS
jgi:hypothetical protein